MLLTDMCDVEAAYLLLIMCGGYEVNMALTLVVIRPVAMARSCYILPSEYILSPPPPRSGGGAPSASRDAGSELASRHSRPLPNFSPSFRLSILHASLLLEPNSAA